MQTRAGCDRKDREQPIACPNNVGAEFGSWHVSAPSWSVAWLPARAPNKPPIAPRSSCVRPLACQKPAEIDPSRSGQTHWSIKDLAQYVAAHPELGLGTPSKSTIGVILKRHKLRLDRL